MQIATPHEYNMTLSWLVTPLYIVLFFAILLIFHPILIIARLFSFAAFYEVLVLMCRCILQNLYITAGTLFAYRKVRELPTDRPILVIANHQSMYDIPMIIQTFPARRPRFIAKRQLARWIPSISFAVRHTRSALIDRNDRVQSVAQIRKTAAETNSEHGMLCIFPEGTRARDGVMKKFKTAGFVSILEEMPHALVVPVAIRHSWELLRFNLLPIPARVKVSLTMLDPVEPAGKDPYLLLQSIENEIRKTVEKVSP